MNRPALLLTLGLTLALSAGPRVTAAAQPPSPQTPAPAVSGQQAPAQDFPGIRNFTRVDASFACGGAVPADQVAAVKQAGFRSIVNMRAPGEAGNDIDGASAAAKAAGIKYISLPFTPATPDPAVVDKFLATVSDPANQPMLIHCASGGRVSMLWAIKRVMVDGWSVEKAMDELPNLSKNVSPALKAFALDYLKQHGKMPAGTK